MKNLMKNFFVLMMTMGLFALPFTSCSSDDDNETPAANKTELNALIASCETLLASATTVDYPQDAINAFSQTVALVKTASASTTLTQQQVNNLTVQLTNAQTEFEKKAYKYIPEEALVIGLSFDEANTTELTTTGIRQLKAVLKAGPSEIFGANTSKPTYTAGIKGNAMYFSNGGHLEIANYQAPDFLSSAMSISVWVKPTATRAGNYIASYNYWNNWKFQLQNDNQPFFTAATTAGTFDADTEHSNAAPNGEWTHVVMSLDLPNNMLIFYVNGVELKKWTNVTKPGVSGSMVAPYSTTLPIMIGAATTYSEALAKWNWTWNTPAEWSYFYGLMDEFKLYNIALSAGQVSNLYNSEKP